MISYLAKLINFAANSVQNILLAASLIGKAIIIVFSALISTIFTTVQSILLFFQIVYEDNITLFSEEIPTFVNNLVEAVINQWLVIQNVFTFVLEDIFYTKTCEVIQTSKWFLESIILIVTEVILIVKKGIILIGDTIWLILTFVPVHLPALLRVLWEHMMNTARSCMETIYIVLLNVVVFLTDVPVESFVGMISAIIMIRFCVHFREIIHVHMLALYWLCHNRLLHSCYAAYNYFMDSEVRLIANMSDGQEISQRESVVGPVVLDDANSEAEALCVVCQERQKCVLILPCRHICLCRECCIRLYGYQRTCPICRTFIYHSVTVYL